MIKRKNKIFKLREKITEIITYCFISNDNSNELLLKWDSSNDNELFLKNNSLSLSFPGHK